MVVSGLHARRLRGRAALCRGRGSSLPVNGWSEHLLTQQPVDVEPSLCPDIDFVECGGREGCGSKGTLLRVLAGSRIIDTPRKSTREIGHFHLRISCHIPICNPRGRDRMRTRNRWWCIHSAVSDPSARDSSIRRSINRPFQETG